MEDELLVEPPNFYSMDHIFDLSFHPSKDYLAYSDINGHAAILGYDSTDTKELFKQKIFDNSARCVLFSPEGNSLASGAKSGDIKVLDQNGQTKLHLAKAHSDPVYSLLFLNESILASGDDDGTIKIWDTRSKEVVFSVDEQKEGTISQMVAHSSMHFLLATSTSGYLGVYDLRKGQQSKEKLYALSDQMEEEYHCLSLIKHETRVAVGTASGALAMYHWDWFGDSKDRVSGHPEGIEAMIKYNEDVVITGGEDGWIRVVSFHPNSVNMFQRHADDLEDTIPITKLDISHDRRILASISTDCSINFFDMTEIEEEVEKLNYGEKIQLEQDAMYEPVKKELMTKGGKTENKEKRAVELKKKVEFFKDM